MNVAIDYELMKDAVVAATTADRTLLHVHAGLAIFVGVALVLRRPFHSGIPIGVVVLLEGANELLDFLRYYFEKWPWTPKNTLIDIVATLAWPVILFLVAQLRRRMRLNAD